MTFHRLLQPANAILFAANLVPLVGVVLWGWDAFVLLMLYWLETAVIAFWTVLRIATLPPAALGEIKFEGQRGPPSPIWLAIFFSFHAGIFMLVHFMFLWVLFSGDWSQRIHGPDAFVSQMVVGTGLWMPLGVLFVVRGALILFDSLRPALWRRLGLVEQPSKTPTMGPAESNLFALYVRIVVMQVTIILGAWLAMLAGSAGGLVVLIAIKTAVDLCFQLMAERFHAAWVKAQLDAKAKAEAETRKQA